MAMVMLNIGILAIVAAFNSGIVRAEPREPDLDGRGARGRARWSSTGAITYSSISLDSTSLASVGQHLQVRFRARRLVSELHRSEVQASCSGSPLPNVCNSESYASPAPTASRTAWTPTSRSRDADQRRVAEGRHGGRARRAAPSRHDRSRVSGRPSTVDRRTDVARSRAPETSHAVARATAERSRNT